MRQWRFTSLKQIDRRAIKKYVKEAISLVQAGKEIKPTRRGAMTVPPQLQAALVKNRTAGLAFKKLSQ